MLPPSEPDAPAPPASTSRAPRGPKMRVPQLPLPRLRRPDTLLLVVDIQDRLVPAVRFGPRVVERAATLAQACAEMSIPIVATEQNPARLGPTTEPLKSALGESALFGKMQFSAMVPEVLVELERAQRPTILLCGLESHVCVLQTALDFLERGQRVFIAQDAISSRFARDEEAALERMRGAGAVLTTTESALFELLETAQAREFKSILRLIK